MGSKTVRIRVPTFVKWAGGKTQLLGQYRPFFPKKFERYFEPFLGSGAVFFYLRSFLEREGAHKKEYILSDINPVLINGFVVVRDRVDDLIEELRVHEKKHSREHYYEVRENFNTQLTPKDFPDVKNAADFIYLNKTCYNGLYRVNSQGKFNVPMGRYKRPSILQESKLRKASRLLQGVTLKAESYEKLCEKAREGDFVYLDPPYHPLSPTSNFTSYTKDSFTEEDQRALFRVFQRLAERGCILMLSNSYTLLIKSLYRDYRIEEVYAKRAISSKGDRRGAIKEVLILYDPSEREGTREIGQKTLILDYSQ